MDTIQTRMTTADYLAMPDDGKVYELHDGVLIEMPAPSFAHTWMVAFLVHKLFAHVLENSLGTVAGDRAEYFLDEGIVLQPDVSFVANLFPPIPKRVEIAPDLAVEILSPSNTMREMKYKMRVLFQYGTRLFWLVDPEEQDVTVYQQAADGAIVSHRLTIDDTLTGADVLPDFRLPLRELFRPNTPSS